jgi:hypothetical protein
MAQKGHRRMVDHGSTIASPTEWLSYPNDSGEDLDNDDALEGADTTNFVYLVTHGGVTFVDRPARPNVQAGQEDDYLLRAGFGLDAVFVPNDAFKIRATDRGSYPRCIWFNNKSKLGDKRLRWLIVDTCESLQLEGYNKHMKQNLSGDPARMWQHAFHGLNMVFGFHGDSSDAWWVSDRGCDFGRRAGRGDKLEDAWTDEAHSHWLGDSPVALACGTTVKEAQERLRDDRVTVPKPSLTNAQARAFAWRWRS